MAARVVCLCLSALFVLCRAQWNSNPNTQYPNNQYGSAQSPYGQSTDRYNQDRYGGAGGVGAGGIGGNNFIGAGGSGNSLDPFRVVYEWFKLDYNWLDEMTKAQALSNRRFIPENNALAGIKTWRDRLIVTIPRWKEGVPVTIASLPAQPLQPNASPRLDPFPNWQMQEVGNCSAFQFVQSVEIDTEGRIWILDSGRTNILETTGAPSRCPPKLVIIDLNSVQFPQAGQFGGQYPNTGLPQPGQPGYQPNQQYPNQPYPGQNPQYPNTGSYPNQNLQPGQPGYNSQYPNSGQPGYNPNQPNSQYPNTQYPNNNPGQPGYNPNQPNSQYPNSQYPNQPNSQYPNQPNSQYPNSQYPNQPNSQYPNQPNSQYPNQNNQYGRSNQFGSNQYNQPGYNPQYPNQYNNTPRYDQFGNPINQPAFGQPGYNPAYPNLGFGAGSNFRIVKTFNFPSNVATPFGNYLNDLVLDNSNGWYAYITDHGDDPGIIVYSFREDRSWKVKDARSMRADPDVGFLSINNIDVELRGKNIDGIALSPAAGFERTLYFSPLGSYNLYSVPTSVLKNPNLPSDVSSSVVDLGRKQSISDGMIMDNRGNLYFGLLGLNAIAVWNTNRGTRFTDSQRIIARDNRALQWPDSFSIDDAGNLWVVTNRLQNYITGRVNVDEPNYRILKAQIGGRNYMAPADASGGNQFGAGGNNGYNSYNDAGYGSSYYYGWNSAPISRTTTSLLIIASALMFFLTR